MANIVEQSVLSVAKAVEDHLDEELAKLERLDEDDIEMLRERRLREMKGMAVKRNEWLAKGHGEYYEIPEEKQFFEVVKKSEHVVCHFYRENWPCKVIDKHMVELCRSHLEARFVKINAEKSPFLCERLRIFMLPTLALIRNGKVEDYVVGFDDLGGSDDFDTAVLEARLARAGVLRVDGVEKPVRAGPAAVARKVRSSGRGSDSEEED